MSYDFTTLSPDDFENLVADLFSRHWGARLEAFKPGKDGGIDLRNSRTVDNEPGTIVQCKRYAPHKFAELLRSMDNEGVKLESVRPQRYVLATSVALSPPNKEALLLSLAPWCKSAGDIYGPTELNGLLRDYPEVERAHFKLWLSSTAVLERVLHARIFNLTQATVESTRAHLSKIVVHDGFSRALELLHQEHHVLIVGNPGIGKTTLARMLMCHYIREGFEPLCVMSNIEDAWDLVHGSGTDDRKLVVLYDDFLGRLRFDSHRFGKNEELSLFEFLNKVRRSPNLRFIFTTREYIIADAKRIHGTFATSANEILKCTLSLEDYSRVHRAKMLFNHLYFSDLPDSRLNAFLQHGIHQKIVQHRHFNPRIVETISKHANSRALNDEDYVRFVQQEFDNPSQIWELPFRNDISPTARAILAILWTFHGKAELEMLRSAVDQMDSGREFDGAGLFSEGIRQLDGNFISTNRYPAKWGPDHFIIVQFHNPSVEEFIENFLLSEVGWLRRLVSAIVSFRQVRVLAGLQGRQHALPAMNKSFWLGLRMAALKCQGVSGGYVINFRTHDQTQEVWEVGEANRPRDTRTLLEIEAKIDLRDEHFAALSSRVLSVSGWTNIMHGIGCDESIAYNVNHLYRWIIENSGWPIETKAAARETLRRAIRELIADDDQIWPCTMATLRVLAETITTAQEPLSKDECEAFANAALDVISTVRSNVREFEEARGEVDELINLAKICGVDMKDAIERLGAFADGLDSESRSADPDDDPEAHRFKSEGASGYFDIDSLFTGLLDR